MVKRYSIFCAFCSPELPSHYSVQEFITSATTLGALLGGLAAGIVSDWTGRRAVLGIADVIFIGGAIAQAVCHTVWSMVSLVLFVPLLMESG